MRTKTNRCKTLIRRASVLILTLLMGGGPAGAQEDINKLPTDVQDALATIANISEKEASQLLTSRALIAAARLATTCGRTTTW